MKYVNLPAKIKKAVHDYTSCSALIAKGMLESWYKKWSGFFDSAAKASITQHCTEICNALAGPGPDEVRIALQDELSAMFKDKVLLHRSGYYIKVHHVEVTRDDAYFVGPCCQVITSDEECTVRTDRKYVPVPLFRLESSNCDDLCEIPPRELSGMLSRVRKQAESNVKRAARFVDAISKE